MKLDETIGVKALSLTGYALSAVGQGVSDWQWTATSLSSGNRFAAGNDASAGNANHRITQLVKELIQKGILQGTIS